jgi:hypothetical protein
MEICGNGGRTIRPKAAVGLGLLDIKRYKYSIGGGLEGMIFFSTAVLVALGTSINI